MRRPRRAFSVIVIALALLLTAAVQAQQSVPPEYSVLAASLKRQIEALEKAAAEKAAGPAQPAGRAPIFAAELLTANGNAGPALLSEQSWALNMAMLDRLKALGVGGVSVSVPYPLLSVEQPRSPAFLAFYVRLATEIRRRQLKLLVATQLMHVLPALAQSIGDYSKVRFEDLKREKLDYARMLIAAMEPDYLTITDQPSSEAAKTKLQEFLAPARLLELVRHVLDGLDRKKTLLGAGIGTWDNPELLKALLSEKRLDYVDLHVFPINGPLIERTLNALTMARAAGKRVVIGEAWLMKASDGEWSRPNIATATPIIARDPLAFWAPLDAAFLGALGRLARARAIEWLSPFWTGYFFAYLTYEPRTRDMKPYEVMHEASVAAWAALASGRLTDTATAYRDVIAGKTGR